MTLALRPSPVAPIAPIAASYTSADDVIAALSSGGLPCTPLSTYSKYPMCQLRDGAVLTVRLASEGRLTGGLPVAPFLAGPNWYVAADDAQVLPRVQEVIGGGVSAGGQRPTAATQRMSGYTPPCRIIPDSDGTGSIGLHVDAEGDCPTR